MITPTTSSPATQSSRDGVAWWRNVPLFGIWLVAGVVMRQLLWTDDSYSLLQLLALIVLGIIGMRLAPGWFVIVAVGGWLYAMETSNPDMPMSAGRFVYAVTTVALVAFSLLDPRLRSGMAQRLRMTSGTMDVEGIGQPDSARDNFGAIAVVPTPWMHGLWYVIPIPLAVLMAWSLLGILPVSRTARQQWYQYIQADPSVTDGITGAIVVVLGLVVFVREWQWRRCDAVTARLYLRAVVTSLLHGDMLRIARRREKIQRRQTKLATRPVRKS